MRYFDKQPAELLEIRSGGAGCICITCMADPQLKLAFLKARFQAVNHGPIDFAIDQPIQLASPWKEPLKEALISAGDAWFVTPELKTIIEQAGVAEVEFIPAFVEDFDKKASRKRPRVSLNDMSCGTAGGGQRHELWWMNLWAYEDILDREACIGKWSSGDRITRRNVLGGEPGHDLLGRCADGGRLVVLRSPPTKSIFQIKGLGDRLFVSPDFAVALETAGVEVWVSGYAMAEGPCRLQPIEGRS